MTTFGWALVGPGKIARRFAAAVAGLQDSELRAVLGRDAGRAGAFATACQASGAPAPRVARDLDELLADPCIDGVYIATPHAQHGEWAQRCLEGGKPVLCEKPLVPNHAQAAALVALARQKNVFLMEAVWTRFLPAYDIAQSWLREQAVGTLTGMQSSLCFRAAFEPRSRLFDPALAGGALLDLGIYNLTVTRMALQTALGACPEPHAFDVQGVLAPTGVDRRIAATLRFKDGIVSQFVCGLDGTADNSLSIFGERGVVHLPARFWQATEAVLRRTDEPELRVQAPFRINGFEYEIEEAQRCIRAGWIESEHMPHAETLATLAWMDEIRRRAGVRYPFE